MLIAICDDNPNERTFLQGLVSEFFKKNNCPAEINVYQNGAEFLQSLTKASVNLAFLDIYMPGMTGVEVAREVRKTNDDMLIVLTTTSPDHALDGYSVDALGYLVKPLDYIGVQKVLNRCMKNFGDSMRFIEVLSNRLNVRILQKNIRFAEVLKNVCIIHTLTETVKSYCSLGDIEVMLDENVFLRTHRSFIVNMNYIADSVETDFILDSGEKIPISRKYRLPAKQAYRDFIFSQTRGM